MRALGMLARRFGVDVPIVAAAIESAIERLAMTYKLIIATKTAGVPSTDHNSSPSSTPAQPGQSRFLVLCEA